MRTSPTKRKALARLATRSTPLLVVSALLLLAAAGPAQAAITTTTNDPAGASQLTAAINASATGTVTGSSFASVAPAGAQNGVADAPLSFFPTHGSTFSILTSGNAQFADDPNNSGGTTAVAGNTYRGSNDTVVLKIDLNVPAEANCLTFDFAFYSDEYPEYVGSAFNDAFLAELDNHTWSVVGNVITAPDNFAFDSNGNPVSINSSGPTAMTAGNAAGTTYDGATVLLSAATEVTPGAHSLYLSIFDAGDFSLDSAVFLDNLVVGFTPDPQTQCEPGAQPVLYDLALEPATDENPVGTQHTVTATLTDQSTGQPISGATINFNVSGANSASGTGVTDANGEATFTYTGTNAGDDTITATYTDPQGNSASAQAQKTWTSGPGPPATLTLEPETDTNQAGEQHCVTATVTDAAGNPTPGITVQFSVSGANSASGSATTDANGQAQFCYSGTNTGNDTINAFADVDGDGVDDGASDPDDTASKTYVAADPATLDLTPATATNVVDSQHCVTAHVEDAFGNPTPGITVRFSTSGSTSASGSATTNSTGDAQFCYTGPALPGTDTVNAFADTDNDGIDDGAGEPDDTATKTWVVPASTAGCKITDGGRITANNGDKGTFGANAQVSSTGVPRGEQNYQDHGPAQPMHVKSTKVTSVTCSADGKQGSIFGTATINGSGTFNYRIDVQDFGEPGNGKDTYRIRLSNGYDSGVKKLEGGNIQIHK